MAPEGSRWAGDVRDDIDRNGVLGVPIHDVQELQRFDGSGKAADCALFLRAECLGRSDDCEKRFCIANVGVRLVPVIASERVSAGIERALQQLAGKARIGAVESISLPAKYRGVEYP